MASSARKVTPVVEARAPGRVNLIGDHTDYTGGLALPLAIDRQTIVRGIWSDEPVLRLTSHHDPVPAVIPLPADAEDIEPAWVRLVAAIAGELGLERGFTGTVESTVPVGAGLSSSAALEVAVALALGALQGRSRLEVAGLCQRAEQRATGVPTGILDQLTSLVGVEGHALLLDCHDLEVEPVPIPAEAEVAVRFVSHRTLVGSEYADRVAACAAAEREIGPLRLAQPQDVATIGDAVLRARARHVVTENERVRHCAEALRAGDLDGAGRLMTASHASLRDDYGVSTSELDATVQAWLETPGVYGARLTGAGFGGCVVALSRPGAMGDGWVVGAVDGAVVTVSNQPP